MKWAAIESTTAILSAFGVVALLVYVKFQVRQNTRTMHDSSIESTIDSSICKRST